MDETELKEYVELKLNEIRDHVGSVRYHVSMIEENMQEVKRALKTLSED